METHQHCQQQADMVEPYTRGALLSNPSRQGTMSIPAGAAAAEPAPVDASFSASEVVSAAYISEDISVPAAAASIGDPFTLAGAVDIPTTCSHVVSGRVNKPADSTASPPVCGSFAFLDDKSISYAIAGSASSFCDFGRVRDECSYGVPTTVRRVAATEGADDCGRSAGGKIQGENRSRSRIGSREFAKDSTERSRSTASRRSSFQRAIFRAVTAASSSFLFRDVHSYSLSLLSKVMGRKCKKKGALFSLEPCRSAAAALLSAGATCWAQAGEHVLVPAWLALANHVSLLLYVLLFFERIIEIIFHTAACLLPAFVYVLLALLISILSIPPEASPGTAPAPTGVALRQTLAHQQRLMRVVFHPSLSPSSSAAADLTFVSTVAGVSPFKTRRHHLLIARRYTVAAESAASRVPPRYTERRFSRPTAAQSARPAQLSRREDAYSSTSHSSKSVRSNSLPSNSIRMHKFSSSTHTRGEARVTKEAWHFAALLGLSSTPAMHAWNLYLRSLLDRSSLPSSADTGKAGDAVDTEGTERRTAKGARRSSRSPAEHKHRNAATYTGAPVPAATAAVFGLSGAPRKAQQRSRSAREEEQLFRGREGVGLTLSTSTKKLLSAPVDAAKAAREAERKHSMFGKINSPLTYGGRDVKPYFSTIRAVTAGNKTTVTTVGGVVPDVPQNRETPQREYVGANVPADAASADLAGEPRLGEEREEKGKEAEGRGAHMWIVALSLAYGYVLFSHVSRSLLLELPMYSFALYLCQLLRLQGLSFSAAPNSTSAAIEELTARMRAQLLQYSAIEEVSVRESNAANTTRNVRSDSNTTISSSASSSGSTSTTPSTSILRSNSSSRNESSDRQCNRPIRRWPSVDSSTPSTSEVVAHRSGVQDVGSNDVAGSNLEETLPPEKPVDSSGLVVADGRTSVSTVNAPDDDSRARSSPNSVPAETAAEIVSATKALPRVADGTQVAEDIEKTSFSRSDGCTEKQKLLRHPQKDCKPPSVFILERCHGSQRHTGDVAKDGVGSGTKGTTAAEGAVVADAERMNACAENTQSIRAEMRSDTKMSHMLLKSETPAGTRVSDEIDGKDTETERLAGNGGGNVFFSGRSTLDSTTQDAQQRPSAILPATKKKVMTTTMQVTVARKTEEVLENVPVEGGQQSIAAASVPVANRRAAEAQKEARGSAAALLTAETSKHLAGLQISGKRNNEGLTLKKSEEKAEIAHTSTREREQVAPAVKAEKSGLLQELAQDRGSQDTGHSVAVSHSRACDALSRPLLDIYDDNNVRAGQRRGYSSDRLVVPRCRVEDSETSEGRGKAGVTCGTEVVRVNRRSISCPSATRRSSGSSFFPVIQVSKNLGFNSSAVTERAAFVPDCVRLAAEETSKTDDRAKAVRREANPFEAAPRRLIALLLRSFASLHWVGRFTLRGLFRRCSSSVTAVVASHYVQNVVLWFASRDKLLQALHPYHLLSLSPVRFFPNASQRLILTTCCFWLLRGLHGDIFYEQGNDVSRGAERASTSFSGGWAGSGAAPSAASNLLMNARGNKGSVHTVSMGRIPSNNSSGGNRNTSGRRTSQSRKGESVWRGPLVERYILPLNPASDSLRESSSGVLYTSAGRGTFTALTTYRQAILTEPSVFPLEKRALLMSAVRGNHQETRKLGQLVPQRRRQKRHIFTWLPYGDGLNSHSLLLYAFLLELLKWAGEYILQLRQWTTWLALLLLLLLLVSYSLLSLSSTLEILPWQLLHILLVLRHTSLCTYAARVAKHPKPHLQAQSGKGRQRLSADVRKQQEADEKNGKQQPLEAAPQARNLQRDVQCSGDDQSEEDDGVDEDKICIFCFEAFVSTDVLRLVNACGHIFHRRCMDIWLFQKNKETCPFCGPFRSGSSL